MSHILNLVERQLAMSNVRDRLAEVPSRPGQYVAEDGTIWGPCLLISRECGSGGDLVARRVGELLGWNVFDARIVDEIARNAHVSQRVVQSVDERSHSGWERTWREFLPDDLPDEEYFHFLMEVIRDLAVHGNAIIVGRGAQYILPPQCTVRVRLVAPLETRAKRMAECWKMPLDEARLQVRAIDKQRETFIWKLFGKQASSPLNQDVVINTEQINIERAADLTLAALKEKLGVIPPKHCVAVAESVEALKRETLEPPI